MNDNQKIARIKPKGAQMEGWTLYGYVNYLASKAIIHGHLEKFGALRLPVHKTHVLDHQGLPSRHRNRQFFVVPSYTHAM